MTITAAVQKLRLGDVAEEAGEIIKEESLAGVAA